MAQRRMFSLKVIDTDEFIDMPSSARLLYYDLSMRADDDGFVSSPKKIQRMCGCSDDDLKLLVAKRYLIPFESGICVIKHWRLHNYIRTDRYNKTIYTEEFKKLNEIDGIYECEQNVIPNVNQMSYQMDTQVRLGKDRLGKGRLDKVIKHKTQHLDSVFLTEEELQLLIDKFGTMDKVKKGIEVLNNYIQSTGKKYKSHYHVLIGWVFDRVNEQKQKPNTINTLQNLYEKALEEEQR